MAVEKLLHGIVRCSQLFLRAVSQHRAADGLPLRLELLLNTGFIYFLESCLGHDQRIKFIVKNEVVNLTCYLTN